MLLPLLRFQWSNELRALPGTNYSLHSCFVKMSCFTVTILLRIDNFQAQCPLPTLSICRVHCRPRECHSCDAAEWEAGLWNPPNLYLFWQKKNLVLRLSLFITDKPCLQHVLQKSCHAETLTFGKRKLHPELWSHLHMPVTEISEQQSLSSKHEQSTIQYTLSVNNQHLWLPQIKHYSRSQGVSKKGMQKC